MSGQQAYEIHQQRMASDGEWVNFKVTVFGASDREVAEENATRYFNQYGRQVVEDTKAKGYWPLPPDHPNAPSVDASDDLP